MLGLTGALTAVACTSKTACLAIGRAGPPGALLERYDGSHWTASTIPDSSSDTYRAIACAASDRCVVVGQSTSTDIPAAATLNGTRWTRVSLPGAKVGEYLSGVSCPTTTTCMAVGGSTAYQLSGDKWKRSTIRGGTANQVACARVGRCVAVGSTEAESYPVWAFASDTWKRTLITPEAGTFGDLGAVSCPTVTRCVAVGTASVDCGPCGETYGVAVSLTGGKWTLTDVADGGAAGVACTSPTACTVVGYATYAITEPGQEYPDIYPLAAVAQLSGTTWSAPTIPAVPGPGDAGFSGVSCVSAASCVAVGNYEAELYDPTEPLVATDSASGWSALPLVLPAGVASASLDAVSCVPSLCVAVGAEALANGTHGPFVEELVAGEWTPVDVPTVSGSTDDTLTAVSCTSTASCVAVGFANGVGALVLTLQGSTWSATSAPLPAGTVGSFGLRGVACSSSASCVAVGSYSTMPSYDVYDQETLVETLSDGTWQPSSAPDAAGDSFPYPEAVGCAGASVCLAVGDVETQSASVPLAVVGPTPWTASAPNLPAGTYGNLEGAACASSSICVGVGLEGSDDVQDSALIVTDASGTWSSLAAPAPAGTSANGLSAVSCADGSDCTAVGYGTTTIGSSEPELATISDLGS